jgi:uncharacterized protein (DUF427 family)
VPVPTAGVLQARARWRFDGRERPPWAERPGPGQESVWDFPRPPRIEPVSSSLRVVHAGCVVAETQSGLRILETAGAPTYYFPPEHVDVAQLVVAASESFCEWKGRAQSFDLRRAPGAAWSYPDPYPEYEAVRGWFAFLPARVDACFVGEVRATPQPGGYYGGWVTPALAGPIKGGPGTGSW